jgi:RNA polymerase sigma factor (TIGR02999 family)
MPPSDDQDCQARAAKVTTLLNEAGAGNAHAAAELLPLLYRELRKLAAQRMAAERPGQTLQATALVHEAYLRLVGGDVPQRWNGRGHFFAAAAEAMRRILIERARRRSAVKHGGNVQRVDLETLDVGDERRSDELLALDEALSELARHDGQAAQLVKLRYFAGLGHQEAAEAMGISRRAADRIWKVARAWLYQRLAD